MRDKFYKSKAWNNVRLYIWYKQNCLCARCHRAVYVDGITEWLPKEKRLKGIVHHKEYLNDNNYTDDDVALNEDKLEGICIDCHNQEHFANDVIRSDVMFDESGNLVPKRYIPPIENE